MNHPTDIQLLQEYATNRSEAAFAELVRRHVDFTYSAARRMVCDPHLAQDVTQSTFVALADNASQLLTRPVLSGWLHRTARNIAAQTVRTIERRRHREQEAVTLNELLSAPPEASWEEIAPHLDAALDGLSDPDRDAVLLRYFENKSAAEMAQILGVSDDAAQKRVSRAVERLREFFTKRGITVGAGGLTVAISTNAVSAAPAALATTITAAAVAGSAATVTVTAAATKIIAMTTLQKIIVTATAALLTGATIYEARQTSVARSEAQVARQETATLTGQIGQLQQSLQAASNQLADLRGNNQRLNQNPLELLKLRGDVSRLQMDLIQAAQPISDPTEAQAWLSRLKQLKERLAASPKQQIPELACLTEADWLDAARHADFTHAYGLDKAFYQLRLQAKKNFATQLEAALRQYAQANNNQAPDNVSQLQAYLGASVDPALLLRYEMIQSGTLNPEAPVIAEKASPDTAFTLDSLFKIGTRGYWWIKAGTSGDGDSGQETNSSGFDRPAWLGQMQNWQSPQPSEMDDSAELKILDRPRQAYLAAHNGKGPENPSDIEPYLQTAAEKAALARAIQAGQEEEQATTQANAVRQQFDADQQQINQALIEFTKAHSGAWPQNPAELQPYLKTPDAQAALQRVLTTIGKQ